MSMFIRSMIYESDTDSGPSSFTSTCYTYPSETQRYPIGDPTIYYRYYGGCDLRMECEWSYIACFIAMVKAYSIDLFYLSTFTYRKF